MYDVHTYGRTYVFPEYCTKEISQLEELFLLGRTNGKYAIGVENLKNTVTHGSCISEVQKCSCSARPRANAAYFVHGLPLFAHGAPPRAQSKCCLMWGDSFRLWVSWFMSKRWGGQTRSRDESASTTTASRSRTRRYVLSKRMILLYIHNLDIFDAYLSYVRIFERFCPPQPNTIVAPKHGVLLATTMYGWTSYESMLHTVREIGRF